MLWSLGTVAPGIPPSSHPPSQRNTVSSDYTRKGVQLAIRHHWCCSPASPLIWSPVSGCHMGTSFLSVSVSAQLSTHDTHSKGAPWSSEHKENNKGLRASSDGNVILQAFYRHLNCPRVCLYMHTEAHARPHTHTTNSMLWLKGKTTLSHHYLCLNYSLDATLCHYMDAITEH